MSQDTSNLLLATQKNNSSRPPYSIPSIVAMKYDVIVGEVENSFGASVPDLPGCVAVADTKEEVLKLIPETIEFHIEGLHEQT